jgi:DNA modification methylase
MELNKIYNEDCIEGMKKIPSASIGERILKLNAPIFVCSTAIACLETKRNYIGFELDKSYYETSQNRISSLCGGLFSNSFSTESSIETE